MARAHIVGFSTEETARGRLSGGKGAVELDEESDRRFDMDYAIEREYTPIQKTALVLNVIFAGDGIRTCDVQALTGTRKWDNAERMMQLIHAVLPSIDKDPTGMWCLNLSPEIE